MVHCNFSLDNTEVFNHLHRICLPLCQFHALFQIPMMNALLACPHQRHATHLGAVSLVFTTSASAGRRKDNMVMSEIVSTRAMAMVHNAQLQPLHQCPVDVLTTRREYCRSSECDVILQCSCTVHKA